MLYIPVKILLRFWRMHLVTVYGYRRWMDIKAMKVVFYFIRVVHGQSFSCFYVQILIKYKDKEEYI